MKVRTAIAGAGLSATLSVLGCGTMAIVVSGVVSACSGGGPTTPDAGATDTTFSPDTNSPNPGVTTQTVTAHATATETATANPTASPVTAAPATGGGGTAGTQDALLFVVGGVAVLAGGASLAYRSKVSKNR
jgi:hypothetical protein